MRILFVIHQFYPEFSGGTEHVALNLARMAQRGGHHVEVLACAVQPDKVQGETVTEPIAGSIRAVHQGVPVTFIPHSALPATSDISIDADAAVADSLQAWMRENEFDIAHVMHGMRMGSALLALHRAEIPYMLTLTDFFLPCARINLVNIAGELCPGPNEGARCARDCAVPPWTAEAYAARYQQAKDVLLAAGERCTPSEYVAQRYRASFPGMEFRVLPHGIDLLKLAASASNKKRQDGNLHIVYVGAVIEQKGLDVLLRALAKLPGAPVKLTIMGGFWGNTGYHDEVQALAKADPRVEFTGRLTHAEVFERMSEADLLCLPSRVPESFSLVLHESASLGVPALVSDIGAPNDFVTANDCGAAVAVGDVAAWSRAIREVLDNPQRLQEWRDRLPLPLRVEEEGFFYESLYRRLRRQVTA